MRMVFVGFAISATVLAQHVEFEVASVKPSLNAPFGGRILISGPLAEEIGFQGGPGSKTPGRIHYSGVSMKMLLARAYGIQPYQISGPSWIDTERYDIDATYPVETTVDEFRKMLQHLLAERFHLDAHRESRQMARYRLVVAKGGPKLSPAQSLPVYTNDEERKATMEKQAKAHLEALMNRPHTGPFRTFSERNATMAKLAQDLSMHVDRPVTDDTGLEGSYSFWVEFSPNESATADASLPSIFVAVQQQLGLKLEPEKGPVEFLVIDRADKVPVAN